MKDKPNTVSSEPLKTSSRQFIFPGSSVDAYALTRTLDAYEVQELDCHSLARFLPTTVVTEDDCEEQMSETPAVA